MKTKDKSNLHPMFPVILLALVPSLAFGAGLAAIKEQSYHHDAGANIVFYSTLTESGPSVRIETTSRTFTIETPKLAGKIELMSALPANITTDTELEPVRRAAKEYRDFTTRFPKSAPALTPHITALDTCIWEFEGGKVRFNGEWMPKEELIAAKQKKEEGKQAVIAEATQDIRNQIAAKQAAREKANQEIRDKIAFSESQKAKGLAYYGGQWMPKEDAIRLEALDQAILQRQAAAERERRRAEEEYENNGLVLLKKTVVGRNDGFGMNITGTVVNRTRRELKFATIEFKLYDASQAQIGTARATIKSFEAGGRWNFKAHSFTSARHYKFSSLSGY